MICSPRVDQLADVCYVHSVRPVEMDAGDAMKKEQDEEGEDKK